ncbi:hypothetical protein [Pedobacter aquatilis]|uniref:hypothetical protein n=1 Tax=Pedobacter aquatilis TaxID=351343 RepID=UPI00292CD587|nr:hypothetical protein [Pedobacter aquatilis]
MALNSSPGDAGTSNVKLKVMQSNEILFRGMLCVPVFSLRAGVHVFFKLSGYGHLKGFGHVNISGSGSLQPGSFLP